VGLAQEPDGALSKIFVVGDRTTETLEELIKNHCERNTVVHRDGWKAYAAINWKGLSMFHKERIHMNANGERRTMEHSNLIEGLWAVLKNYMNRIYNSRSGVDKSVKHFLYEALWRK
jgi:IS1 family transposase